VIFTWLLGIGATLQNFINKCTLDLENVQRDKINEKGEF
jgi:hypothetical protein